MSRATFHATPVLKEWTCDANGIEPSDVKEDGTIARVNTRGGPHSSSALRLYHRALELNPTDATTRCDEAIAAVLVEGDGSPIRYLATDPGARETFAEALEHLAENASAPNHATENAAPNYATNYYRASLRNTQSVIDQDPKSIQALNLYAYTYWEWEMNWQRSTASKEPPRETAIRAEHYAREEVKLATVLNDQEWQRTATDTLGEVLLGQGRSAEAVKVLKPIVHDRRNLGWNRLQETKWDLAKAEICDAYGRQRTGISAQVAAQTLATLEHDQQLKKGQARDFSQTDLDALDQANTCPSPPDATAGQSFRATLRVHQAPVGGRRCAWSAIGEVYASGELVNGYSLRVWGNGVDNTIKLAGQPNVSISLAIPTDDSRPEFYTQLFTSDDAPVSAITAFEVQPDAASSDCSQSQIELTFDVSAEQLPQSMAETRAR